MIQCNNTSNIVKEIPNPFNEALYLNLEMQNFNFKLMALYNPPRYNKMTFIETLDKFFENENSPNTPTVICGDFNIDVENKNLMVDTYLNSIAANGFEYFLRQSNKGNRNIIKLFRSISISKH